MTTEEREDLKDGILGTLSFYAFLAALFAVPMLMPAADIEIEARVQQWEMQAAERHAEAYEQMRADRR